MSGASATTGLARLNAMGAPEAEAALLAVCGSHRWAKSMNAARPFASGDLLLRTAEARWKSLGREDWLEAFSHHPRIGERNLAQAKFAATREQSSREQSGMGAASEAVQEEFRRLNAEYEKRFGHVFLICASGKSADEMLSEIKRRIVLTAEEELLNAAEQQNMIVRLRLERMLSS